MKLFLFGVLLGILISFILVLLFDKPELQINGKVRAKKGSTVNFDNNISKEKRVLFNLKNKEDGIFKRIIRRQKHSKRNS